MSSLHAEKAIDEVRATEQKQFQTDDYQPVLKKLVGVFKAERESDRERGYQVTHSAAVQRKKQRKKETDKFNQT